MKNAYCKWASAFMIACVCTWCAFEFAERTYTRAKYFEGDAYLRQGDYEKTVQTLNGVIRRDESDYLAHEELGIAYLQLNNAAKAIEEFNASIYFKPDCESAYYNRGLAFLEKHETGKAILDFTEAIQLNPKDIKPLIGLGLAYYQENHFDKAIYEYSSAISLDRKCADAYYNRGLAFYHTGDYDNAISDYSTSIQLDPGNGNMYRDRGYSHFCKGDWSQATNDFEVAIELNRKDALAYNNYAWLLATCQDPAYRDGLKAVKLASKACELSEWNNWNYIDTLAAAYAEATDFDQASKLQMQAIAMKVCLNTNLSIEEIKLNLYQRHKSYHESDPHS